MAGSSSSKEKFFDNVINLRDVMQHPQAIQMRDGVLHIRDVQGPKGSRSVEARLEAMEQEVFRCKGMVERGLNANHLMIADYTRDLKVDGKSMKYTVFSLNEQISFLHSQIHDLQSQVVEYEARFKEMHIFDEWRLVGSHRGSSIMVSSSDEDNSDQDSEETEEEEEADEVPPPNLHPSLCNLRDNDAMDERRQVILLGPWPQDKEWGHATWQPMRRRREPRRWCGS
ncbi:40S ribosomal protein S5-1 [Hordeum vulgare]|nr:40S ribosomal protein S5-1 [Hordeum vulgare]